MGTFFRPPRWTLVTVGVGTFMSTLDGSVVNTILPVLGRDRHASAAGVEWVTAIYRTEHPSE